MTNMKSAFQVINRMVQDGVIENYAVGGAVAALNYIEPTLTGDLDILISVENLRGSFPTGLVTLEPLYSYLRQAGYTEYKDEGIVIEGWPVQFLPVANPLDAESLSGAAEIEIPMGSGELPIIIRVLRPEHIVATALKISRPKDRIRINQFLQEKAVDIQALRSVLERHDLQGKWVDFCKTSGIDDPLGLN